MTPEEYFGPGYVCADCGKKFISHKALVGHLGGVAKARRRKPPLPPALPEKPWGWVQVAVGHWVRIDTEGRPWVARTIP